MKKIFIAISVSILAVTSYAQRPIRFKTLKDITILPYGFMDQSRFDTIDTTLFTVRYRLSYIQNVETKFSHTEYLILQVGHHTSKCYTLKRQIENDRYTRLLNSDSKPGNRRIRFSPEEQDEYRDAGEGSLSFEVFCDSKSGKLTYFNEMPGYFSKRIAYTEIYPAITWEMGTRLDSINGFLCFDAKATYGGRKWHVWFTPDVPSNAGPWKLCGLPGLILLAEDDKLHYRFECLFLGYEKIPIVMYDIPTDNMSKRQWLRIEKGMYQSPYHYFSNGGKAVLSSSNGDLDESWTIPYNPIELE